MMPIGSFRFARLSMRHLILSAMKLTHLFVGRVSFFLLYSSQDFYDHRAFNSL